MTVFEVCVKVPKYMNAWGLNVHPFFGYPEVTNHHPQRYLTIKIRCLFIIWTSTTMKYLQELTIHKNPPPLIEFQSFHSTSNLTSENLRQVSPLHCLSFCYICLSVSLFVHVSIYTTQIASHFGQQISLCFVCLSISVSVCLSLYVCIFFNAAADCYRTIWLWAT